MTENALAQQYDDRAVVMTERILKNEYGKKRNKRARAYKFTPKQLKVVNEYDRAKKIAGCKPWSRYSYVVWCREFCGGVKKPFEDVTGRDVENYFLALGHLGPVSQARQKRFTKFFFKWFYIDYLEKDLPIWVNKIPSKKVLKKRAPQEMLTGEELQKLYDATRNPMHQTMLRLLAESGLRAKELVSLRVGDISFEGALTTLWADGKTGQGAVYLYHSTPYLMSWLRTHPKRNDPIAPLFYTHKQGDFASLIPLSRSAPNKFIQRLAEKAEITGKRVYAHLFRFTAATRDAETMTDALMRLKYRWSPYSQMPAHYASVHNGRLKEMMMKQYGLLPKEEPEAKPIECPTCHFINEPGERFCTNCYRPITLEVALAEEQRKTGVNKLAAFAMKKGKDLDDLVDMVNDYDEWKKDKLKK